MMGLILSLGVGVFPGVLKGEAIAVLGGGSERLIGNRSEQQPVSSSVHANCSSITLGEVCTVRFWC